MKISVAQTKSIKGDVSSNIDNHLKLIQIALPYKIDAIFFPELSLTSYEPQLAKELAIDINDDRLSVFQKISNDNKLTIGIGAPTTSIAGVLISMIIFQPNVSRQVYSKQELHSDELPYFVCGDNQKILTIDNFKVAPAICFESVQVGHIENSIKLGAQIYLTTVAKPQKGIDKAFNHYSQSASKYSIPVLMSNCIGYCDNFESVGQSSVWIKKGTKAGDLGSQVEGVLIFDTDTEETIKIRK